jgi:CDP-glucose 4,6-dehydratase
MNTASFWRGKKALVTGATGLVGNSLCEFLLKNGASVAALVRDSDPQSEFFRSGLSRKVSIVNGALEDYASVERAISEQECDTVFHLGAQAIVSVAYRSPLPTFESNIRGSYNLLEACRVHAKLVSRVVIASSDKAYGDVDVLPYTEDMPPMGRFPYDVSKSCTDLLSRSYYETYRTPVTIARCGNIYGRGDLNWTRIVPGTIRSLLQNEAPLIRSDGKFTRDYVYVDDVAEAYALLACSLEKPGVAGEAFNFGPGRPYSVLEVVAAIQKIMGKEKITPRILNEAKAEIRDQHLDSAKAKTRLDWKPTHSLESGLAETIKWYERFLAEGIKA